MNKGIFDIQIINVYFTSVLRNPSVFDIGSVAKSSNSKRELQNEQRLVEGEVTMCIGSGSKIDIIIIVHSLYFQDLVFALSMNMIGSYVYCDTVIHLSERIIAVLFT